MTEAASPPSPPAGLPPQPHAIARAVAHDLVTKYRLRLTDPRDSRLGELGGDRYELGAAAWTGRRAAFVGFYTPPADPSVAGPDLAARCAAAARWGAERLTVQGAERCDVLIVALGPVSGSLSAPASNPAVGVGAVSIDTARGDVTALLPVPRDLPSVREIKSRVDAVRGGAEPPTLAAVDLAERQTVAGGYSQPARRQLSTRPVATYGLIASFVVVFILEKVLLRPADAGEGLFYMGELFVDPTPGGVFPEWWRFISSAFLHSPSSGIGGLGALPTHLLFNSLAMYFIGRLVEQLFGWRVLLATFVLSAVGGGLLWVGWDAATGQQGLTLGASGGITGLLGLLVMLGRVQGKEVPVGIAHAMRQYAITYGAMILLFGFLISSTNNLAHAGGFITGTALGAVVPPLRHVGGRELSRWEVVAAYAVMTVAAVAMVFAAVNLVQQLGVSPGFNTGPPPQGP